MQAEEQTNAGTNSNTTYQHGVIDLEKFHDMVYRLH